MPVRPPRIAPRYRAPRRERGVALLGVLVFVAVIGALAAAGLEKMRLAARAAGNVAALDQARAYARGVEELILLGIDDRIAADPQRTTLAGGWNGAVRSVRLPAGAGTARGTLRDGGNWFNLNSLVEGEGRTRVSATLQFAALMGAIGIREDEARRIAAAVADWADGDSQRLAGGAETGDYRGYRPADGRFADPSELRAVRGVSAAAYQRIRPWICVLPEAELSPVNVNTLRPDQAPLLAMLGVSPEEARRALAARPAGGWASRDDFWRASALRRADPPLDVRMQPQLRTQWFLIETRVAIGGTEHAQTALVDARLPPARVAARTWGAPGD